MLKIRYGIALSSSIYQSKNKAAKNLVLHHGLLGCAEHFSFLQHNHKLRQIYNLHLLDARNHGKSLHCQTNTIADLADDLYEYLQKKQLLSQDKTLTLVGHSMGGYTLMQFTKKYDSQQIQRCINKIIFIDNSAYPISKLGPFIKTGEMLQILLQIDLNQPLDKIYKQIQMLSINQTLSAVLKSEIIQAEKAYRWRPNLSLLVNCAFKQIGDYDLGTNNPARWTTEVEIIYGQNSRQFTEDQLKKYCAYYPQLSMEKCHKIDKAGHWVHFDNPQMLSSTLLKILQ